MSEYTKHLYMILYPNEALVASQLSPEEFGKHYSIGSLRHLSGKVIFAEVDIKYRTEYLRLDEYLKQVQAHPDGTPKRTKFVKSYRVLEHIELSALKKLYLVTTDGAVLGLDPSEEPADQGRVGRVRVYQEICPLHLVVASSLAPRQFGAYITEGTWSKGAPKIFFTQWDIDAEAVVNNNDVRAFSMGPLPNVNPSSLPIALKELLEDPNKKTKTVSLNPSLDVMSYKHIQPGFWFSDGVKTIYYRMPTLDELAEKNRAWWRHL
jgi:hypothetical protein